MFLLYVFLIMKCKRNITHNYCFKKGMIHPQEIQRDILLGFYFIIHFAVLMSSLKENVMCCPQILLRENEVNDYVKMIAENFFIT